ncbi:nucleotidyltransferase domain-containing protein [Microcoleus sp. FACHB-SPT15]|uniref:nucleotidyltransferase domain-containing protein n=1 Tax=Microcoleus sp. FACHB-SPT15 TaxID=2692830 RepID=UPI0017827E3B|nr:nucleotidyltransferase domain-containing protein [Microcoleus sp. FACHB-SPT15]MBD1808850.1 nucleotidyltransferase domain-containing protein [Microcoleus sp. FACHB-SPT15]
MAGELVTQIINILKSWAKKHNTKQLSKFYLFGSLINGSGNQFLPDESDIDLIVILQDLGPLNRAKICQKLQKAKHELEELLLSILKRKSKSKSNALVSLVLVTSNEVIWDIHKSQKIKFFRDNKFLNLLDESDTSIPIEIDIPIGLDNREGLSYIIQALEEAQKYRNKYLSINPNKSKEYKEKDIFPKDLARSAAQVRSFDIKNEKKKFDINLGNSYLISLLEQKARTKSDEWSKLNSKVGERYGRSRQNPALNDFDLLLLHELLFDKAYKLLKQNYSTNLSKGGHPARAKGDLPAPPAAKAQSKKTLETKTKSESLTVARKYEKTTLVDPAKLATAKKKSTSRKTPVSKTSTTRNSWTVKDPKNWVMLNNNFFLRKSFETQQDQSLVLQLLPTDMEQVAELKSLHSREPYNRNPIAYADQYEACIMQVSSVLPESSEGKTIFKITLTPTQQSQNSGFPMEMSYYNYSADYSEDAIARLRARRILLGEPLPTDLEPWFSTTQVEKEIFSELWVKLQTQPRFFLPKAWLAAVYCLKMNRIVDDVLELELGPIKNKVMRVRFRGRRRQAYANQNPSIIKFEGSCALGE